MSIKNTNFSFEEIEKVYKSSKKIFFIGIGGISMSSLATFCLFEGKEIFGYDEKINEFTKKLEPFCHIKYSSSPDSTCGVDLVVYSNAIDESNFEYQNAKRRGVLTVSRANFLGYIISRYKIKIGICGAHGKSTTVSYLGKIFEYASLSPCIFCGAVMKDYGSALLFNKKDVCIYEACEYMDSFLNLPADYAGVLNVDYDHPDYFSSLDDIKSSFVKFCSKATVSFINMDDESSRCLLSKSSITYGFESDAIYKGKLIENKLYIYKSSALLGYFKPKTLAKHFLYDMLCAFAISHSLGIDSEAIFSALGDACGVKRRLEKIGKLDTGAPIFEDYGHHPREIECTISSLLEMGYKRIFCVFEPHTFSRTHFLYNEFKKSFSGVNSLYLLPIYSAREKNVYGLDMEDVARDFGGKVLWDKSRLKDLIKNDSPNAVLLLGAGDLGGIKNYL